MTRRERILVLYLADLTHVARVQRQVEFLASEYEVVVAAFGRPESLRDVEFIELPGERPPGLRSRAQSAARIALRLAGMYGRAYWLDARVNLWRTMLQDALPVDAVVVNDLFALPLARSLGAAIPVVFDAHEHWTSESASWTWLQRASMRGAHDWIVTHHVARTAAMMTVSAGIARDYRARAGVEASLVTNAPFFHELSPSPVSTPIRLLHVGVADERRRLEDTIDAVRSLGEGFTLDLVLVRDNAYRRHLEELVASEPRIRVLPPVPARELIRFAHDYDVGVFLLPARYPNQIHVLPNKLFDYLQARLAVAIGPSPEMAEIVAQWDCGVISESFDTAAFAASLRALSRVDVERMKLNADRAARVLTAENNRATVLGLVQRAIEEGAR